LDTEKQVLLLPGLETMPSMK